MSNIITALMLGGLFGAMFIMVCLIKLGLDKLNDFDITIFILNVYRKYFLKREKNE